MSEYTGCSRIAEKREKGCALEGSHPLTAAGRRGWEGHSAQRTLLCSDGAGLVPGDRSLKMAAAAASAEKLRGEDSTGA